MDAATRHLLHNGRKPEVEATRNARWLSWETAIGFGEPNPDGTEPLRYAVIISRDGSATLRRYENGSPMDEVVLSA